MNTTYRQPRRLAAHYLYVRRSLLKNPILSLAADGTVTGIEVCDNPDSREGVEFYSGILIPPMTNAHCHLELSHLKDRIAEGDGFVSFAKSMGEVRNDFSDADRLAAASAADARMWYNGVGIVGDICNGSSTFDVKRESGIHYHNFIELFGLGSDTLDPLLPVASAAAGSGLSYSFTPHSLYSLNCNGFAAAVAGTEAADRESRMDTVPLSVHFMESASEAELFRGSGDMTNWYASRGMRIDFADWGSPVERLIAQTPPERNIMLIHNCFVTGDVIDKVMAHFTGVVTWVLCPGSNRFISNIEPPYQLLRRKGVRIALGTDSLASNRSLDMVAEMRMFNGVPLEELLGWVIENGSSALSSTLPTNEGGNIALSGGFEVGSKTGVVLLTGIDWQTMSLTADSSTVRLV